MAGVVGGILAFVVALPLALSSPFPTPKQGEWVLQTSSFDVGSPMPAAPLLPPPMEPLPEEPPLVTASLGTPKAGPEPIPFTERWNLTVPVAAPVPNVAPPIVVPTVATRMVPVDKAAEAAPPKRRDVGSVDPVEQYLWEVYRRKPIKSDSSGDFTWKDPAAAKKRGIPLQSYVIGGMDPDFREQLYHAGHAMDATGIHWSMLSAFRDDYRQALASGYKAHGGNSQHGGSNATGGYGHGRAIDITTADGEPAVVWHWIDAHGEKFGLRRPMHSADPAHIQPRPTFHDLAHQLREARTRLANEMNGTEPTGKTKVAARTDEANEGRHARR
jgi:hypothetical protein